MRYTLIEPPAGGWHRDTEDVLLTRRVQARALKASEAFEVPKEEAAAAEYLLNAVVRLGDGDYDESPHEELMEIPIKDFLHIQKEALRIAGISASEDGPEDPKPSET